MIGDHRVHTGKTLDRSFPNMTIMQKIYMKLPKTNCEAKKNHCEFLKIIAINHVRAQSELFSTIEKL